MDPVLAQVLATHQSDRYVVQSNQTIQEAPNSASGRVSVTKSLSRIKTGMFWYEDNTFSSQIDESKKLKAVVLFVKENTVYGDSLEQKYMLGKKISTYMQEAVAQTGYRLYRPTIADFAYLCEVRKEVNKVLKNIKKLPWSENLYWAEDGQIVDLFDASDHYMSNEEGAYFRPMITLTLK